MTSRITAWSDIPIKDTVSLKVIMKIRLRGLGLTEDKQDKCEVCSKFVIVHAPRRCDMSLSFAQTDICVSGEKTYSFARRIQHYNDIMAQSMCTTESSARVTGCTWCNFLVAIVRLPDGWSARTRMLFTLECSPGPYYCRTSTLRNCIVRRYSRSGWQLYSLCNNISTFPDCVTLLSWNAATGASPLIFLSRRYPLSLYTLTF